MTETVRAAQQRGTLPAGEPERLAAMLRAASRGAAELESAGHLSPEGKALKEQYRWEARSQWKGPPLSGDVEAHITLYFGTKRRADWDNYHKLSCDALAGIAYNDDSQIKRAIVAVGYDKEDPRIEIALEDM